jgi:thiol:disulfide interchange protein DsbD
MLAFSAVRYLQAALIVGMLAGAAAAHGADKVSLQLELDREALARGAQSGLEAFAIIERGWHINAHKPNEPFLIPTELTFSVPAGVDIESPNYPRADRRTFAFAPGKELLVYEGKVGITTAVAVPADFPHASVRIEAVLRYQACNDTTCLPPATAKTELVLPVSTQVAAPAEPVETPPAGPRLDVGRWMATHGLLVTTLLVALLGLGLNLTPCVYPLISVTLAYFGRQGGHSSLRVVALATTYVLGITASFSAVGVAAAFSGGIFGAALQKPAVLLFIAGVLVLLALSSFGLYQVQPPSWLMQRVSGSTQGMLGAFGMGLTMGVVAAPCVGPVVVGLLLFVGSQQSVWLGFELFFALGFGMGLPYIALAVAAGSIKSLPRSGEWLLWIEHLFGFVLLGLAAHFLTPLLPVAVKGALLPSLIAVAGIYLGFFDRAGRSLSYFRPVRRAVGIFAVVVAAWFALPQPAESAIRWQPFASDSIDAARSVGRPALLDFVADWCIPCHEMERTTYADPEVRSEAERFEMFKADITLETDPILEIVDQYSVQGVPTVILLDSNGTEVQRLVGYVGPAEMLLAMRRIR